MILNRCWWLQNTGVSCFLRDIFGCTCIGSLNSRGGGSCWHRYPLSIWCACEWKHNWSSGAHKSICTLYIQCIKELVDSDTDTYMYIVCTDTCSMRSLVSMLFCLLVLVSDLYNTLYGWTKLGTAGTSKLHGMAIVGGHSRCTVNSTLHYWCTNLSSTTKHVQKFSMLKLWCETSLLTCVQTPVSDLPTGH